MSRVLDVAFLDRDAAVHRLPLSLWALVVSIPLAIPLAVDVVGTISFSVLHVVLLGLLAADFLRALAGAPLLSGGRPQAFLLASILAVGLVNLSYSLDVPRGISHWVLSALLLAGFWVTRTRVVSALAAQSLVDAFLAVGIPILAYGVIQPDLPISNLPGWAPHSAVYLGSTPFLRAFSTFENVLYFALFTNVLFALAVARLVGARSARARVVASAVILLSILALFRTASIGALIGMLAGGAVALALGRSSRLFLIPVGAILAFFLMPEPFRYKIIGLAGGFTTSLSARFLLYESGIALLRDNLLLGVGLGSVEEAMRAGYRVTYSGVVAYTSENFLLERAIESGLLGLLLYGAVVWIGFGNAIRGWQIGVRRLDRDRREASRCVLAFLTGFFTQGLTIAVGSFAHMALLGVFLALASALAEQGSADANEGSAAAPLAG